MTDVHRLEREVAALPEPQLAEFRRWYAEFDAERWDRQLTADVESGAFDRIVADALRDHEAGRSRPL